MSVRAGRLHSPPIAVRALRNRLQWTGNPRRLVRVGTACMAAEAPRVPLLGGAPRFTLEELVSKIEEVRLTWCKVTRWTTCY